MSGDTVGSPAKRRGGVVATRPSLLAKVLSREEQRWEKDEALDVLYWEKQIVGLLVGISFGVAPVTGLFAFVIYGVIQLGLTATTVRSYLRIDEEEYGGMQALLSEGMMQATGVFLLAWILTYSGMHF